MVRMEEPKLSPSLPAQILNPVGSPHPLPPISNKRPFDAEIGTCHSKMRAVVRDLRPHFLEVLRTPDFRNCKAAHEIREKIKLLLEIQQHITESVAKKKIEIVSAPQSVEIELNTQARDQHPYVKKTEPSQKDKVATKLYENKLPSGTAFEKSQNEDGQVSGTFVVGGSAFGWNFVTYAGNEPVYRGVTKEAFRATMKDNTLRDSSDPK